MVIRTTVYFQTKVLTNASQATTLKVTTSGTVAVMELTLSAVPPGTKTNTIIYIIIHYSE